jgi:hypothetical protein
MVRQVFAAGIIAAVFVATAPVTAQPTQPPSTSGETALTGMPVYSSDGQKLGQVTQASRADNLLVADFGTFLGFGPTGVIIPGAMFVQKADRIELKLKAGEVKDHLAKRQKQ